MTDPKDILNSVYKDFFGEDTMKEIEAGTKKVLDQLGEDLVLPTADEIMGKTGTDPASKPDKSVAKPDSKGEADKDASKDKKAGTAAQEAGEKKEEPETDPMQDLQELVGLENLKKDVEELVNLMKLQKLRADRGMKSVSISKHLVFSGNPGTGKTTVARILARLYKQAGILSKGQLVEVDRSGLVAGYVGQTAIKTQEKIKEAMGGILFVDEAYSLVKDGQDYGQEAIDTILKAMEDNREDFVVIVAGYPDLMKTFVESNPGLKSRFNKYFYFEDYNKDELMKIFDGYCKKNDYTLSPEARPIVEAHIAHMVETKDANFANARDVRNYFEHIINRQASRAITIANATNEDLGLITPDDLKFEADVFHWCVIGSGVLANQVAASLSSSEKHDIVSVYSHNPETGKKFAKDYQCDFYDTAEAAIKAKGVDGVYVVTPHTSHYEYAKLALECGKPVLVEKPMTVKAEETKLLFDLAKEKDLYLAEAMWTWFSPVANRVKFWLDCGLLGRLEKVHVDHRGNVITYAPRLADPCKAGGALLDTGVYPITYLYRLFGRPVSVKCEGKLAKGIDEGEEVALTFANGLTATASISITEKEKPSEVLILEGSLGSISLENFHFASGVTLKQKNGEDLSFEGDGSMLNEFNLVAAEIRAGLKTSALVPAQATMDVMEILDECRRQMGLVYPFEQ